MRLAAKAACFALLLITVILTVSVKAEDRSLTNSGFIRPPTASRRNTVGATIAAQQERMLLLESTVQTLTKSLAAANSEVDEYKRQIAELRLQLDALGLAKLDNNPATLEKRLLECARELRAMQEKNEKARSQIERLGAVMKRVLKESDQLRPDIRATIEAEVKNVSEMLYSKSEPSLRSSKEVVSSLLNATVLDQKAEYSLIIINVGRRHGAKIGMPFQITRNERLIGRAVVIDVRESISGAIIQNLESEERPVQTGDRLRVITR